MTDAPALSRKEMEKEARKRDIIDVAAKLFSEKNYHDVKVDDIAEHVGLSKGTLYLYFENKENMFFAIIQDRTDRMLSRLGASLEAGKPFLKLLKRFVLGYLRFFDEHRAFFKIIHSERIFMAEERHYQMHEYGQKSYLALHALIVQLVKRGISDNVLQNIAAEDMTKILLGILYAYTFQRAIVGSSVTIEDETEFIVDRFLHGVAANRN